MISPGHHRSHHPQVNGHALVVTAAVLGILGVSGYFWHQHQLHRIAGSLLERADILEQEQNWADAANYLHRYLQLDPERKDIHVRLAQVYDRCAADRDSKERAVELHYIALGMVPDRLDLRERLATLLLELGRIGPAGEEAQRLLQEQPDNHVGLRVSALAAFHEHRRSGSPIYDEVVGEFERALKTLPGDLVVVGAYAQLLLARRDRTDAEQRLRSVSDVMDQMVAAASDQPRAYLLRYQFRRLLGRSDAQADLQRALDLGSQDSLVLLTAAADARQRGELPAAQQLYQQVIDVAPQQAAAYLGLSSVHLAQGDREQAIQVLQQSHGRLGIEDAGVNGQLAELLLAANRLDEADQVIAKLERSLTLASGQTSERHTALTLRGWWWLLRGNPVQATAFLKQVAIHVDQQASTMELRALRLLGQAYGRRGEWDRAAAAFERLIELQPGDFELLAGAAEAWSAAGNNNTALRRCRQAWELKPEHPGLAQLFAELQLQRQAMLPDEERDWREFEQAIMAAEAARPDDFKPALLKARRFFIDGGPTGAVTALEIVAQAEANSGGNREFLLSAAALYQEFGQYNEVDRLLMKAGPEYALHRVLAQAGGLLVRGEIDAARQLLQPLYATSSGPQRELLLTVLTRLEQRAGNASQEETYLRELSEIAPQNTDVVRALAAHALHRGQLEQAEKWERKLRSLEGDDGTMWRALQAHRLLATESGAAHEQASKLQHDLEAERPWWSEPQVIRALIAERQGRRGDAIQAYQSAIDLGDRRITVVQRLIQLLQEEDRLVEASRLIAQLRPSLLREEMGHSAPHAGVVSEMHPARAVAEAQATVQERPQDVTARICLAQTLSLVAQAEEAERQWREAIRLAPHDLRVWAGLFLHYVRTQDRQKAIDILRHLSQNEQFPPASRHAAVAQGYESLGEDELAEEHYRYARQFAALKASPTDLRLQATLAMREEDREGLLRARESLEAFVRAGTEVRLEDRLLLAKVCESLHDLEAAQHEYHALLQQPISSPAAVSQYVEFVLRQGDVTPAVSWCLEAWKQQRRAAVATALARLLVALAADAEATAAAELTLQQALREHPSDSDLLHALADLRLTQQQLDEALGLYERVVELRPQQALAWNNMATILAERPEALDRAMFCVERALQVARCEEPLFLDTKAAILLAQGKSREAAELLERVTHSGDSRDPRLLFHLAVAYARRGFSEKARAALEDAYGRDLAGALLSRRERQQLEDLEEELTSLP